MTVFDDGRGDGPALYLAGHHSSVGGITGDLRVVVRWDGRNWDTLGTGLNGTARCLAVFDDGTGQALYVGGDFTQAGPFSELLFMIRDSHPHYLAALVLAGFCGMRRSEVHGQLWKDIDLERKFVRVSSAKRGTPAKRLITLYDEAIEWLLISPKNGDSVCPGTTLTMDRIRKIGQKAGLKLPPNCFRHSYISCRVAATGDIATTALEGGTSARMIHRHYRELVTKEEGEDWFNNGPSIEDGKVIGFE